MKTTAFIALLLSCLASKGWAVTPRPIPTASPAQIAKFHKEDVLRDWRVAPWTQSEKPYQKIRQQVDAAIKRGEQPTQLLKKYEPKGEAMHQPGPLYRWAYIAYRAYATSKTRDVNLILRPLAYMDYNIRPHAYSWARLRFLMETLVPIYDRKGLRDVALRIYKREPNDMKIRHRVISLLTLTGKKQDRVRAIQLAQQEVTKSPKDVRWREVLSFATKQAWMNERTPQHAQAVKRQYQKLLSMYPPKVQTGSKPIAVSFS